MTLKRQSPWLALYTASSTGPDRSEIGPYLGAGSAHADRSEIGPYLGSHRAAAGVLSRNSGPLVFSTL
jgi:hypothetical protein